MRHYKLCYGCRDKDSPLHYENYIGPKEAKCVMCGSLFESNRKFWGEMNFFNKVIFYLRVIGNSIFQPVYYFFGLLAIWFIASLIEEKFLSSNYMNSLSDWIEGDPRHYIIIYLILIFVHVFLVSRNNIKGLKQLTRQHN